MDVQLLRKNIEERNMQTLVIALEKGKINLADEEFKDISSQSVDEVCRLNLAYKVSDKLLVTKKYLYDLVLSFIKEGKSLEIVIENTTISPSFISNIIENLMKDGLVEKVGQSYIPNAEKIISKESVESLFKYTIGVISLEEVVKHFRLNPFAPKYEITKYSDAGKHCKNILTTLVTEGKISVHQAGIDQYYWNQEN